MELLVGMSKVTLLRVVAILVPVVQFSAAVHTTFATAAAKTKLRSVVRGRLEPINPKRLLEKLCANVESLSGGNVGMFMEAFAAADDEEEEEEGKLLYSRIPTEGVEGEVSMANDKGRHSLIPK